MKKCKMDIYNFNKLARIIELTNTGFLSANKTVGICGKMISYWNDLTFHLTASTIATVNVVTDIAQAKRNQSFQQHFS